MYVSLVIEILSRGSVLTSRDWREMQISVAARASRKGALRLYAVKMWGCVRNLMMASQMLPSFIPCIGN